MWMTAMVVIHRSPGDRCGSLKWLTVEESPDTIGRRAS